MQQVLQLSFLGLHNRVLEMPLVETPITPNSLHQEEVWHEDTNIQTRGQEEFMHHTLTQRRGMRVILPLP